MIIVFAALDDCFGRMSIASVQDKGIVLFEKRTIAFQFHFLIIKSMSCKTETQCDLKQIKKFFVDPSSSYFWLCLLSKHH